MDHDEHLRQHDEPQILGRTGWVASPPQTPETLGQLLTRVVHLVEHQTTVLEHLGARLDAMEALLRERRN